MSADPIKSPLSVSGKEEERTIEARLEDYLTRHLQYFAEQENISLPVYYRVSPEFIAAVRSQRIELARLRIENAELRSPPDVR